MLLDTANISSASSVSASSTRRLPAISAASAPWCGRAASSATCARSTTLPATASCRWRSRPGGLRCAIPGAGAHPRALRLLDMIEFGLEHLPEGPLLSEGSPTSRASLRWALPKRPRRERPLGMTGDNQKLFRWRCRAATYANWPACATCCAAIPSLMRRSSLAVWILLLLYRPGDPGRPQEGQSTVVSYKEIERYGIDRKKLSAEIRGHHDQAVQDHPQGWHPDRQVPFAPMR